MRDQINSFDYIQELIACLNGVVGFGGFYGKQQKLDRVVMKI
jgi:hypothetical protein